MKKLFFLNVVIFIAGIAAIFFAFGRESVPEADRVLLNDAAQRAAGYDSVYEKGNILGGAVEAAFAEIEAERSERNRSLRNILIFLICALFAANFFVLFWCERRLLVPFRRLRDFAARVAHGDLDIPLKMDEGNVFGAFTESFDLMRERLRAAREAEYAANRSKKELVASLSHDIRTPLASIRSATDILLVKAENDKERAVPESINAKIEQINALVSNMFHATLEELQALAVNPSEITSAEVAAAISAADYEKRLAAFEIPDCLVVADLLRLQQIFDNIFHNSYKYAGTEISVNSRFSGGYLEIIIRDNGPGVEPGELKLIFNKFYRGQNAGKSDGYGLGLFLAKYFAEKMQGEISCENYAGGGFAVALSLKLAGM